jgi:hypothetical protein
MPARLRIGPLPPARRKRPPRRPPAKPPPRPKKPPLHIYSILAWGDEHYARTSRWPTGHSGVVRAAPWETWRAVEAALQHGRRGCRGGDSLALLFHRHRGRPLRRPPPRLTVRKILAWADAYRQRKQRWPSTESGEIPECPGTTWTAVDKALRSGHRGCRPGGSLPLFLHRYRGKPLPRPWPRPRLTVRQILAWADEHHRRTGRWPAIGTRGPVGGDPDQSWKGLNSALCTGVRGLPGGDTLPKLLNRYRGVQRTIYRPRLTIKQILKWADRYRSIHGRWPGQKSGRVAGARETWCGIHLALRSGLRGLPTGHTLATLLRDFRGAPYLRDVPPFTIDGILAWAEDHRRRHGTWPTRRSGPIPNQPGDTWAKVDGALQRGQRGLPGGDSLYQLQRRAGRSRAPCRS